MNIDTLVRRARDTARNKGWRSDDLADRHPALDLMLVVSELSEAMEELRAGHGIHAVRTVEGKPEGFGVELADAVIRIAEMCGHHGIDLEQVVMQKMAYNDTRGRRHGGKAF